MFFRSPFFRLVAHDFDYMLSSEMRRNERIMARELERALDSFAALEEEAIQRHYHQQQRHRQRLDRHHEARPQEARKEAVKPQEIQKETAKPQEIKNEAVKPQENKADAVKPQQVESKEIPKREQSVQPQQVESKEIPKREQSVQPQQRYERRGDVFSPWNSSIEDLFFRDVSPFGNFRYRSPFDDFHSRMNSLERFSDEMNQMRADIDSHFKNLEAPQEYPKVAENTSYFMRVETNDNGNVRVKTVQKNPGSEWVTKFEEYKRNNGNAAVEKEAKGESKQAVEQKLETKSEKPVEIKEEPYKTSAPSASA